MGRGDRLHLHPVERLLRTRSTETSLCAEGKAASVDVNGDRGRRNFGVTDVDGMGRAWWLTEGGRAWWLTEEHSINGGKRYCFVMKILPPQVEIST